MKKTSPRPRDYGFGAFLSLCTEKISKPSEISVSRPVGTRKQNFDKKFEFYANVVRMRVKWQVKLV